MSTPLVTIRFTWLDWRAKYVGRDPMVDPDTIRPNRTIERHWYHVPRDGEHVKLTVGDEQVEGNVRAVLWLDDGSVDVTIS